MRQFKQKHPHPSCKISITTSTEVINKLLNIHYEDSLTKIVNDALKSYLKNSN